MRFPKSYHDYIGLDESLFLAKPDRGDVFRSAVFRQLQDTFLKDAPDDFVLFGDRGVGKSTLLADMLTNLPVSDWEALYMHPVLGSTDASSMTNYIQGFLGSPGTSKLESAIAQFAEEKRGFALVVDDADAYKNLDLFCNSLREKLYAQDIRFKVIQSFNTKKQGQFAFEMTAIAEAEIQEYLIWGIKDYTKLKNAGFHELSDYIFSVSGGNFREMQRLIDIMLVEFIETSSVGISPDLCLKASNKYYSGVSYKHSGISLSQVGVPVAS